MICKKCGANIADASKFCEHCGNPVQDSSQAINTMENSMDVNPTVQDSVDTSKVSEETVVESVSNDGNQVDNNQQIPSSEPSPQKKKKTELIWVITAIAVVVVIIGIVAFSLLFTSKNSVLVLKKAVQNLEEKGENSATVVASVSIGAETGESMSLSAKVKVEKKSDDQADMQITVNESMFFDEMNVFASLTEKDMTMYLESSLIDMMGSTYSETPVWVYYKLALDEIVTEENEAKIDDLELEEIIDNEHFVYVDKIDNLRHYELIIDQELIDTIKLKLNDETVNETIDSMEPLEQPIKIDFYINSSNELSKVELDMSEYMTEEDSLSNLVVSIEFIDLGSTKVDIPSDAKNSVNDLDTYMITYSTYNFGDDPEFDYVTEYDYEVGSDTNYDYNYDVSLDGYGYGV